MNCEQKHLWGSNNLCVMCGKDRTTDKISYTELVYTMNMARGLVKQLMVLCETPEVIAAISDMFWDESDTENSVYELEEVASDAGYDCPVIMQTALRLPNVVVTMKKPGTVPGDAVFVYEKEKEPPK